MEAGKINLSLQDGSEIRRQWICALSFLPLLVLVIAPVILFDIAYGVLYGKFYWIYFVSLGLFPSLFLYTFPQRKFNKVDAIVLLLLTCLLLQNWLLHTIDHNRKLITLLSCGAAYFSTRNISAIHSPRVKAFVQAVFLSVLFSTVIVSAIYGALQQLGWLASFNKAVPLTGTFYHSAPFAGYLAFMLPLALNHWYNPVLTASALTRLTSFLAAFAAAILLIVLPFTHSRAAIAGAALGILYVFMPFIKPFAFTIFRMKRLLGYVLFFIIVLISLTTAWLSFAARKESVNGRALVWKIATAMILKKPVTGFGTDGFRNNYPAFQRNYFMSGNASSDELLLADEVSNPFNEPIQWMVESGIPLTFLLFIAVWFSLRQPGKIALTDLRGARAAMISFLFFALFSYPFSMPDLALYFFILLALCNNEKPTGISSRKIKYSSEVTIRTAYVVILAGTLLFLLMPFKQNLLTFHASKQWGKALQVDNIETAAVYYLRSAPALEQQDKFRSDFAYLLFQQKKYNESLQQLSGIKGPAYQDLVLSGENCIALQQLTMAHDYFLKAYYLLPNQLYPLYLSMQGNLNQNPSRSKQIAAQILSVVSFVPIKENLSIRESAKAILK